GAAAAPEPAAAPAAAPAPTSSQEIHVPDIGSAGTARVIEVLVQAGDRVSAEQSLITLESDKASMEIPSPAAGVLESVAVQLDAEVGTGDLILTLKVEGTAAAPDRKSTRLNSSHVKISYAVFCLKKKNSGWKRAEV